MTTENTSLTVIERAAVALGSSKIEAELVALAAASKSITCITNKDGRQECHAAAMVAMKARTSIAEASKDARDDAMKFGKAVIAEESRLTGIIKPEEDRLKRLRDEYDAKVEADKKAKEEAETARIAGIKARIAAIAEITLLVATKDCDAVSHQIELLQSMEIDGSFGEFYGDAVEAKGVTLSKLHEIHAAKRAAEIEALRAKQEREAEDARLKFDREELDRKRVEQEKQLQAQRDELSRQKKILDDQCAEQARIRKEEQERADKEAAAKVVAAPTVVETVASVIPAPTLSTVLHAVAPPVIAQGIAPKPEQDTAWKIAGLVSDMQEIERVRVLQFCERVIEQRKEVA